MADVTVHPNHKLISSEDVEGTKVYSPDRDEIGEIDHLMIDKQSGHVTYAVMSFGGILGMGHSHYPIPWQALKYDVNSEGFVTGITADKLRDAPEFSDDSWAIGSGRAAFTVTTASIPIGSDSIAEYPVYMP